ncbi:hypothetical protein CYMTET_29607 [Cymbomonas tetramitiformis]|uniref:DOMON domain-containing protein n=1 Tax=Cymbomonas tetramitiformis TaxID=36881 RepID=A0AAE0FM40_9CHLO|nr:hypothetical protein CYMTET_29607 [Cymbomonas tetramitiformis]
MLLFVWWTDGLPFGASNLDRRRLAQADVSSACTASSLESYEFSCLISEEHGVILHYTFTSAESIKIGIQANTSGYAALGWTETADEMIGSEAVIGWIDSESVASVNTYVLTAKYAALGWTETADEMIGSEAVIGWIDSESVASVNTYVLTAKSSSGIEEGGFEITNASASRSDNVLLVEWTRPLTTDANLEGSQNMLWSLSSETGLLYHDIARGELCVVSLAYFWQ